MISMMMPGDTTVPAHAPRPNGGQTAQGQGTQIPPEKLLLQQIPGAQQTPLQQTCSSPSPQGKIFSRGDQAVTLTKTLHSWHGFAGLMKECGKD